MTMFLTASSVRINMSWEEGRSLQKCPSEEEPTTSQACSSYRHHTTHHPPRSTQRSYTDTCGFGRLRTPTASSSTAAAAPEEERGHGY